MADSRCRGYLIYVKSNGENGSRLPIITDSCYIGAGTECDVRLEDASDRHCVIKYSHSKNVTIHCLCSETPVLLNDQPVIENGSSLNNGDIIQIVDVKFKWEENKFFADADHGRHSIQIEKNLPKKTEPKRHSEPVWILNEEILTDDKEEKEPYSSCNKLIVNEVKDETKVTSDITPLTKSSINASPLISSNENNLHDDNFDIQKRSLNNSLKDTSQVRRSRPFSQTFKTKPISNTPGKKKTTPAPKSFFRNTPLQENKRAHGREVKSRFFFGNNNFSISATPLAFEGVCKNISVPEIEENDSNHVDSVSDKDIEVRNIVSLEKNTESKEDSLGNEMKAEEVTFDTTVPSDMTDAPSRLTTPKCFTKAVHSTPKAFEPDESELETNLETGHTINVSNAIERSDDPTEIYNLDNNSIAASPVKSFPDSDIFCKKKKLLENSRTEQDSTNEVRRHHTRNTSNILKRTLEECSEDNLTAGEKSFTTPEKSITECSSHLKNSAVMDKESEFESHSPEKEVDSRNKTISTSIKSLLLESNSEQSAENGDVASSLLLETSDKSQKSDDSSMMARCSRNLSSFSPPENNKSQEYMDSVIVSTPKKQTLLENDEVSVSLATVATPSRIVDGVEFMSTPQTPDSPARHRRSTGIVPFVGTPSDVYRTTKGGLTPAHISRFNRTSMEVEVSMGSRESLSGIVKPKFVPKKSSERKSTPLKADKSIVRDSLQTHSPIVEEYALECEESQNESLNNDSQFKFVSKRRHRLAKSSFGIADRIMEESEINPSDLSNGEEEEEVIDDDDSLVPLESFDENSDFTSTRIVVHQTTNNDIEDVLDSTFTVSTPEEAISGSKLESPKPSTKSIIPKSILTPLPRQPVSFRDKSAKKVTFFNVKEDSVNTDSSTGTMTDVDSEFDLQLSSLSRVNSTTDFSSVGEKNISDLQKNHSDNEQLYLSDKSSEGCSINDNSFERNGSIVEKIVAKRNKIVKRLSSGRKSRSPSLSGVKRLMNPQQSPKCDYLNVNGVQQLMKTPESLIQIVKTPGSISKSTAEIKTSKTPKALIKDSETPEFNTEYVKTPEFAGRSRFPRPLANRQKTPASFAKCTETAEDLAESLSTPKALKELSKVPEIIKELVETPKNADSLVSTTKNEGSESQPSSRKKSTSGNSDSTFTTPTMRRCSKHFRIHRSSICQSLASSLNSSLNETLAHDCSASLENSFVESNVENGKNNIQLPIKSPKTTFQDVLKELKEKLEILQEKQSGADKEVLEKSINLINEVLVDEPAPGSDIGVTEEGFQNTLLELKERFSYSSKLDVTVQRPLETETCQFLASAGENDDVSIAVQLDEEDSVETVSEKTDEVAQILHSSCRNESISECEKSPCEISDITSGEVCGGVDVIETTETPSDCLDVEQSGEIESNVFSSVETGTRVCNNAKLEEVSHDNFNRILADEPMIADTTKVEFGGAPVNVSCIAESGEVVDSHSDLDNSEDIGNSTFSLTSASIIHNSISGGTDSENILGGINGITKSIDIHFSPPEVETTSTGKKNAQVIQEPSSSETSLLETVEEKQQSQTNLFISEIVDKSQQPQINISISEAVEEKQYPSTDSSIAHLGKIQRTQSSVEIEHESDSQSLELLVVDSDEVSESEQNMGVEEKSTYNKTVVDVAKSCIVDAVKTVEKSEDSTLQTTEKHGLPENHVEENELENSTITTEEMQPATEVTQKSSCVNSSSVLNDICKTGSPASNLTLDAADVDGERTSKIFETIIAKEKSKRFFEVSANLLVHEENKENLLSLAPVPVDVIEKSISHPPVVEKEKPTPLPVSIECNVTRLQQQPIAAVDSCETAESLKSPVLLEDNTEKNMFAAKTAVTLMESVNVDETYISLTASPYPSDVELDSTCEENLSCVEPSISETEHELVSAAETSADVTKTSQTTITSCEADVDKTADTSSETLNSSQVSGESLDNSSSAETCSTTQSSAISSPVSGSKTVASNDVGPLISGAQIMTTPPKSTAVCVSIEKDDQLVLGGPNIVAHKAKISTKLISTSTPLSNDASQKIMEIPQSCSTTIEPSVSTSVNESREISSDTVVDGEQEQSITDESSPNTDNSERSGTAKGKGENIVELNSSAVTQSERMATENVVIDDTAETQNDSAFLSVPEVSTSSVASKEFAQESESVDNPVGVVNDLHDVVVDVARDDTNSDFFKNHRTRGFSVVLEEIAETDLLMSEPSTSTVESCSKTTSVSSEITETDQETAEKTSLGAVNVDNEGESARPKRGRPAKRYTECKSGSSTQFSKRIKKNKNESSTNVMDISVELSRVEIPEKENPVKAIKRKTVHFDIEPEVKRSTRSREVRKAHIPTPKKLQNERRAKTNEISNPGMSLAPANALANNFGSPCSVILPMIESDDETSAPATSVQSKKPSRNASAVCKESVSVRRTQTSLSVEKKQGNRVEKAKKISQNNAIVEEEKQSNRKTTIEVSQKKKDNASKTNKNGVGSKDKSEIFKLSDNSKTLVEEKRSKKKVTKETLLEEKTKKDGPKGKNKNETSKTDENASMNKAPAGSNTRSKRKAAEEVAEKETEKDVPKGNRAVSQSRDKNESSKQTSDAKALNEMATKVEKRSRRKAADVVIHDGEKKANSKSIRSSNKSKDRNEESKTTNDASAGVRTTRQRKALEPVVVDIEPRKITKRGVKTHMVSSENVTAHSAEVVSKKTVTKSKSDSQKSNLKEKENDATASRARKSRKDAVEMQASNRSGSKSAASKTVTSAETSKSKPTKRTASVVLDPIDDLIAKKKRKQSPDSSTSSTVSRTTRNKKNEMVVSTSEIRINLKQQKVGDKDGKKTKSAVSFEKTVDDKKSASTATGKRKKDPSPSENVRNTRTTRVKESPKTKGPTVKARVASTSRVTRSQNATTLPKSRAKK